MVIAILVNRYCHIVDHNYSQKKFIFLQQPLMIFITINDYSLPLTIFITINDIHCRLGLANPVPEGYIAPVDISCSLRDTQGDIVYLKPRIDWNLPTNPLLLKVQAHFLFGYRVGVFIINACNLPGY